MFTKILFPTDFSDASKKALNYIGRLKSAGAEEVVVLHVIDDRDVTTMFGGDAVAPLPVAQVEKILAAMEQTAVEESKGVEAGLREAGFRAKVRLERGIPSREILRVEEEESVSMIILGSHGKSLVKEMLLGSVSEEIVRKCRMPVLVIK